MADSLERIGSIGAPPLLISGMHRSGTSATARLLHRAGLDVGSRLMAARLDNPVGYYEDLEFSALNRALIAAGVGDDATCRPDWAFADRIVADRLAPLRPRAAALVAERRARGRAWGFKDPRTTALLDFYDDLVPDARYLFVYRAPWEVVESLLRTIERPFRGRADLAVHAWTTYNARILAFRGAHPGRTALVHVDAVARRPDAVVGLAQAWLVDTGATLDPAAAGDAFVDELLRRGTAGSPLAELLAADHPDAVELYERLEADADLASVVADAPEPPPEFVVGAARGKVPVGAVVVGEATEGWDDSVYDAVMVAETAARGAAGEITDLGIDRVPGELVAVVFGGRLRGDALRVACSRLRDDTRFGAILLAPGDLLGVPQEDDLLARADADAALVVRRETWLAGRGFAAIRPSEGFEAWSFAVALHAQGVRVARVVGAVDGSGAVRDGVLARRRVLEQLPTLATRRLLETEADRERVRRELAQVRATRAWRLVSGWWGVRARVGRGRRAALRRAISRRAHRLTRR
jgi:hypothetical protein